MRAQAYRQRDDISVPTVEVWESSSRIEKKLDDLRDEQKRHEKKSAERHRTVKWTLAALAVLIIAGIMWFKRSTQAIITDPKILRDILEEKIEQTFQQTRKELLARKAETSEINALYSWHDTALKRLDESVEFIETAAAGNRSSIVQKAAVTLQERGVDQALKELTAMLDEEGQRNKERARELADASLFKAELELTKLDYDGAQRAIKQAIDFDYQWWSPHNQIGNCSLNALSGTQPKRNLWKRRGLLRRSKTRQRFSTTWRCSACPRPIREGRAPLPACAGDPGKGPGARAPRRRSEPEQPGAAVLCPRSNAKAEPLYQRALAIGKRPWARSIPTWPPASTTWRCCCRPRTGWGGRAPDAPGARDR